MLTSSISGGRKDVKHSFPNSNKQTIEDMGLAPKIFNITAVISGDNYKRDRDRFVVVLEEGGSGTLQHPFYGQLTNYVARTYTLLENLTELGEAKFSIVFELSNIIGEPVKAQNTLSLIEDANDDCIEAVGDDFAENFEVTTKATGNFTDAVSKLNDTVDYFNEKTKFISALADKIDTYSQAVSAFSAKITTLIQSPQELVDSITGLYNSINSLYPTVVGTVAVLEGFFDFGDTDVTLASDTFGRIERNKNRKVLNDTIQMLALTYAYFNTAQITFETVDDIDEAAARLETQFQKIIESTGLTDATKSVLIDMRTIMQQFFEGQRLVAAQVITVNTNLISARLLAYQYYEDSSRGEQLIELNLPDDVSFLEGTVKVVTA